MLVGKLVLLIHLFSSISSRLGSVFLWTLSRIVLRSDHSVALFVPSFGKVGVSQAHEVWCIGANALGEPGPLRNGCSVQCVPVKHAWCSAESLTRREDTARSLDYPMAKVLCQPILCAFAVPVERANLL